VEGYVECIATGLVAGLALAARALAGGTENVGASGTGLEPNGVRPYIPPPRTTALGSLIHYITHADGSNYQPANISFDLLPPIEDLPRSIARDRRKRRERQCQRALADFESWLSARRADNRQLTTDC
jgi:methylenetetrahydrofolate--tRNA-(uracil-5-)-methyltransferase